MKRIALQKQTLTPTFIGSWVIEPPSLCDELITYFEAHTEKQRIGITGGGRDLNKKDRIDISISPNEINLPGNELFKTYIDSLFTCYKDYLVQWPFLEGMGKNSKLVSSILEDTRKGSTFKECIRRGMV